MKKVLERILKLWHTNEVVANRYQSLADMIYPSVTNTRTRSPDGDDDSLVDEDMDALERDVVAAIFLFSCSPRTQV